MRVIVRRERPHPGVQLSLFEQADGWRYQAFTTNTSTGQLAFWKPATEPMPASRTASATPKTAAWADSPPENSASTKPG
ncbi:MAG: family transposase [Mycobacterium sp.]|nr:family transposase [Mycobacterium sp.]